MPGQSFLKKYIFTISIFIAASLAMIAPELFTKFGDFELKELILPILMVIMFGMGTSMSLGDFYNVLKMPKAVIVGMLCQFSIMPLLGFTLAYLSNLPPEIAAGVILVGCSPSGLASNVMSYIAKANLALSLTLTMLATLVAPIITPFLMKLLANQFIPIDFQSMLWSITKIVIIPVIAGFAFNHIFKKSKRLIMDIMPKLSMIGIVMVIAIITAAGRDSLLDIGIKLLIIVLLHNTIGYILGYRLALISGLDQQSARTVALEVGMQNAGLASGIAVEMGKIATMGLAPALFGPIMNITGSTLAGNWGSQQKAEDQ